MSLRDLERDFWRAPSAHNTPEGLPDQRTSAMRSTPTAAKSTAATSRGRRDAAAATATGPQNSMFINAVASPNAEARQNRAPRHASREGLRHASSTSAAPSRRSTATALGGNRSNSATANAAPMYIETAPTTNRTGAGTRVATPLRTCAQRSRLVRDVYTCLLYTSPSPRD